MVVHLEGMGLLGSLTAWQLHQRGIDFTWSDNDAPINAWKACTGACYPSAGVLDTEAYETWLDWEHAGIYPKGTIEVCAYWVDRSHKTLPHGLRSDVETAVDGVQLAGRSIHCNAQALVLTTRSRFASKRVKQSPAECIVSHGFSHRLGRYLWGWTRLIQLQYRPVIGRHGRPSFYLRKNRFQFAYCYPQPGTRWYYAGSNLISQTSPRSLQIDGKYQAWKQRFLELSGGCVEIIKEGQTIEGWRPCLSDQLSGREGFKSEQRPDLVTEGGRTYFPVMASNGFRHYPLVWQALAQHLGIIA